MWSIEDIIRQNNEAALDWMMRNEKVIRAQSPHPSAWALSILARKMQSGPPNISAIIDAMMETREIEKFVNLIAEFLPESEHRIMNEAAHNRVYAFCELFSKKYFELREGYFHYTIEELDQGLPVDLMGLSYHSYHDLEMRPGYLLLLALVIYPFEGDFRDAADDSVPFNPAFDSKKDKFEPSKGDVQWVRDMVDQLAVGGKWTAPVGFVIKKTAPGSIELEMVANTADAKGSISRTMMICERIGIAVKYKKGRTAKEKLLNGARVPLLDMVRQLVSAGVSEMIPVNGWSPAELHAMTDGTKYSGCGEFADWACGVTGCTLLDYNYEDCNYEEGTMEPVFSWSKDNVQRLTAEWPKVQEIKGKINHIVEWLEADQQTHLSELVDYLIAHQPEKRLPGPWNTPKHKGREEHFIPLDQPEETEDEYDGDEYDPQRDYSIQTGTYSVGPGRVGNTQG